MLEQFDALIGLVEFKEIIYSLYLQARDSQNRKQGNKRVALQNLALLGNPGTGISSGHSFVVHVHLRV